MLVALPFAENSFDIAVLNGVLEYMGCRSEHGTPDVHQVRALIRDPPFIKVGGSSYLAIDRIGFDPASLFRAPHTGQPLVSWLPRRFASLVSKTFSGDDYHHWTHSLNALKGLVRRAGFSQMQRAFLPVPSYQFRDFCNPESSSGHFDGMERCVEYDELFRSYSGSQHSAGRDECFSPYGCVSFACVC